MFEQVLEERKYISASTQTSSWSVDKRNPHIWISLDVRVGLGWHVAHPSSCFEGHQLPTRASPWVYFLSSWFGTFWSKKMQQCLACRLPGNPVGKAQQQQKQKLTGSSCTMFLSDKVSQLGSCSLEGLKPTGFALDRCMIYQVKHTLTSQIILSFII